MDDQEAKSGRFSRKTTNVGPVLLAVTEGERDNYKLFNKLGNRLQRVGLTFPGIEVRWDNLMVEVAAPRPKAGLLTPRTLCGNPAKPRIILNAGSGALKPGRMTLLLGPPGAGRTILLRALSGQLLPDLATPRLPRRPSAASSMNNLADAAATTTTNDTKSIINPRRSRAGLHVYGGVSYNGTPIHGPACDFEVARAATYVAQRENHLAELSVHETLTFAAKCQANDVAKRMNALIAEREAAAGLTPEDDDLTQLLELGGSSQGHEVIVELHARMLGIDHVMDTPVGDEMLKGISGGQMRRVTCGEMAVSLAQVQMLDEITNGLDAASALALVKALRNIAVQANATILTTLLQPSPEVFDCFHDVMLMSQGVIVFHGPREELLPFFAGLGLRPLPGQTAADFAQEVVASPEDQARYREGGPLQAAGGRKWISPKRIRQAFDASEVGQERSRQLAQPPFRHPLTDLVLHKQRYGLSARSMLWVVLQREVLLFARNAQFAVSGVVQILFSAFLVSTAFVNMRRGSTGDANLVMSVIFFSIMCIFMGGFNFAPIFVKRLAVFYKQRDHRFYTPAAYAVACTVMRLPEVVAQAAVYSLMVYFSVGFSMQAGRFFLFFLNLVVAGLSSITTFQLLGALVRNDAATQGLGAVWLMVNTLVSGFPIARTSIPGWWIWFHWFSPMAWTLRSMAVSELTSPDWPLADPAAGPGSLTVGESGLALRGIQREWKWVWAGIGYVAGVSLLQLLGQIVALTYLGPLRGGGGGPEHEEDEEEEGPLLGVLSRPLATLSHTLSRPWSAHAAPATGTLTTTTTAGAAAEAARRSHPPPDMPTDSDEVDSSDCASIPAAEEEVRQQAPGGPLGGAVGVQAGARAVREAGSGGLYLHGPSSKPAARAAAGAGGVPGETQLTVQTGGGGRDVISRSLVVNVSGGGVDSNGGQGSGAAAGGQLPFAPVVMAFEGVCYDVPHPSDKGKELRLLNDVSGIFRPGVLTSLMGASGAGKTTLMDVLAGRKTGGRASGVQVVNGQPKRMATFARIMGYVEQQDVHCPFTSVEEALLFSARLRVDAGALPAAPGALRAFVHRMMEVVELGPLAGCMIGSGGSGGGGLSTEARKRLTIAVELVANPSVVFMDEPTSGLDARAASLVMRAVRNTVSTGRTVVCTIHQPNREIMDYFDELLLLKPGGRVIFFGPLGPRQQSLVAYLGSCVPGVPAYDPTMNPANWMLEVTAPAAEAALGVDFAEVWASSEGARAAAALIESHMGRTAQAVADVETGGAATGGQDAAGSCMQQEQQQQQRFAQPTHMQLWVLLQRMMTCQSRNGAYNGMRFAITIGLALVLGSLYWEAGKDRSSELGLMNIMGVIYSAVLFLAMVNMLMVMPLVAADRAVFYREKASGMYSGAVFAAAQGIAELPFLLLQSLVYVVVLYCMIHFEFDSAKACWFWLFNWLCLMFFTYLGIGAMNVAPQMPVAIAGSSFFIMMWNLFCGFLIYRKDIKGWYLEAYYANPITYVIYGCVTTQMGDLTDTSIAVTGGSTVTVAQYLEDTFSYKYSMRGWLVLILVAFIAAVRAMAYLGLTRLNFQRR